MKLVCYIIIFICLYNPAVAQGTDSTNCPKIIIEGPRGNSIGEGQQAIFSVKPFKKAFLKTHTLTYQWAAINGTILDGQDKRTVYVDTKNLQGQQVKAIVVISGLDAGCPTTETLTINVVQPQPVRTETKVIARPSGQTPRF